MIQDRWWQILYTGAYRRIVWDNGKKKLQVMMQIMMLMSEEIDINGNKPYTNSRPSYGKNQVNDLGEKDPITGKFRMKNLG